MKEILCITTYPPRECGIATFSNDLIRAIHTKFGESFSIRVCALESTDEPTNVELQPPSDVVKYTLNTSKVDDYKRIAKTINEDASVSLVLIEHEFGLFETLNKAQNVEYSLEFLQFINAMTKPVISVFHTVLPHPSEALQSYLHQVISACSTVIVMTQISSLILQNEYHIEEAKINVIPHGTHLVMHSDKKSLKEKYKVAGRRVLTTFGLLSPGKSIETTLEALPAIVAKNPSVLFLIIGKTHPTILKVEGEKYREMLQARVAELGLTDFVRFVNLYLDLPILLEYLQLTDVYLFTSSDPNQAVSGTFVYALSCGCPIIATPIPHALELLNNNTGIIFDFKNSVQLAAATNRLLANEGLRSKMRIAGLQKIASTAWENAAIAHALLFQKTVYAADALIYSLPPINTEHIKRMSHNFAMIQFARGNRPDIKTGYTLDDNARALMALCTVYVQMQDLSCEKYIKNYLHFIRHCQQADGSFLNYVDKDLVFTTQNQDVNLDDSNGRAICALGYFSSFAGKFPEQWTSEAIQMLTESFPMIDKIQSPRSMAFALKGLCFYYKKFPSQEIADYIRRLANKLVDFYHKNKDGTWAWFESSLTYDNSVLPQSLLYAYLATGDTRYKEIAKESFDFLLGKIFTDTQIKVISNRGWLCKSQEDNKFGEQPVDVAGTVIALQVFERVFKDTEYLRKQRIAFNWFLGNNHLHQIVYNPATGGCYDGLEEDNINLNQGAESTLSYLLARLSLS
ncbi:glycosyl transferase [Bacteroidia bacterium]|nr:glycosyl transferase [Bacteroidia bacterium]